jgi:hypothetical protein
MSSHVNTPMLEPSSSQFLPSPSPLATVENAQADDDTRDAPAPGTQPVPNDLPPLSCGVLTAEIDKVDALNLVTDSIAQQRQSSSLHLVFHPYMLPLLFGALAIAFQYSWRMRRDLGVALMLHSGVIMTYLMVIRYMTGRYLSVAESMRWDWMVNKGGSFDGAKEEEVEDTVIGVRFGRELIGALILRLEPNPSSSGGPSPGGGNRRRTRASAASQLKKRGGRGVIRAWTVALRYRGRGVGGDMLREAVRVTRERCGNKDAPVGFAREHANSAEVLPEVFNGPLRRGEQRAAKALERVLEEWEEVRRHKRNNSR